MARYRKNPDHTRKRVNLTLDPEIYAAYQELCSLEGESVSENVNQLMATHLEANLKERVAAAKRREARKKEALQQVVRATKSKG